MISSGMVNLIMQMAVLGFVIPFVFILAWKVRTKKSIVPSFVGMGVFLLFTFCFESVPNMIFLHTKNPISEFITGNAIAYALYVSLMAAVFEEAGRFVAFKFFLNKHTDDNETAISYGLGHGGIECIIALGITQLQYYAYAQLINQNKIDTVINTLPDKASKTAMTELINAIKDMTLSESLLAGGQRFFIMFLQVALSVLVFKAVREVNNNRYIAIAIVLHTLGNIPAALYQRDVCPRLGSELFSIAYSIVVCIFAYNVYKSLPKKKTVSKEKDFDIAGKKLG